MNYNLKDGSLWQYSHTALPTATADNVLALLKTQPPSRLQPYVKGVFYNLSLPPIVFDKYRLD